ncbi:MAG: ACP S-malonyltransferase [Bifidobacteriaceae bacterium]|jgi:[acyl-carrier-protein] S-malonyltransferase|nr:ACP S-malonyltransferase [Bifidobacteriaceae bacterium]
MRALVLPGQGAQKPGMLIPWLDSRSARDRLERWSQLSEVDLVHYGTTATAQEIRDTAITQPLLTAAGLLSYEAVGQPFDLVAGHSVGEFGAAVIAGVLSADDAMRAVGARGRAMAACSAAQPSGMAAIVGGTPDAVLSAIEEAGLWPANLNGPGQIVAGGAVGALERLAAAAPPRTRVIRLDVAGAFHTPLMAEAEHALRAALAGVPVADASVPLVTNHAGLAMTNGHQIIETLIQQVTRPVRWDLVLETFLARGIGAQLELAPSGVLTGLAKRALRQVALEQIDQPQRLAVAA